MTELKKRITAQFVINLAIGRETLTAKPAVSSVPVKVPGKALRPLHHHRAGQLCHPDLPGPDRQARALRSRLSPSCTVILAASKFTLLITDKPLKVFRGMQCWSQKVLQLVHRHGGVVVDQALQSGAQDRIPSFHRADDPMGLGRSGKEVIEFSLR